MVVELPLVLSCMWPLEDRRELLGAIEARNVAPAVQVVQFGGCEVDCLSVARGIVVVVHRGRRRFWNIGRSSVFTMLTQLSHMVGDSSSREAPPSGRGQRRAGLPERPKKSVSMDGET